MEAATRRKRRGPAALEAEATSRTPRTPAGGEGAAATSRTRRGLVAELVLVAVGTSMARRAPVGKAALLAERMALRRRRLVEVVVSRDQGQGAAAARMAWGRSAA